METDMRNTNAKNESIKEPCPYVKAEGSAWQSSSHQNDEKAVGQKKDL